MTVKEFRKLALSLPGVKEQPHFHRTAFRTKRIFATLDAKAGLACLMLSPVDQSVFCAFDQTMMYPVPNKWGKQGATYVELKKVRKDLLKDALQQAYEKSIQKSHK
jgi:hypothetical protein